MALDEEIVKWGYARLVAVFLLSLLATCAWAQQAAPPSAAQMLAAANRFVSFTGVETAFDMEVWRDGELQKDYRMRVKAKDRDRMRVEFEAPAREKGRILLRVRDKMWMFLPDLGKSIVISSRQSFLGSALSNGDLLRADLVADYLPSLAGEGEIAGQPAYQLELRSRSAEVTYDRIALWVAHDDFRPLRAEYFTRSGKRLKSLDYENPGVVGGTAVNRRMTIHSDLKKNEVTVLTLVDLVSDRNFSDALFVKENLDR